MTVTAAATANRRPRKIIKIPGILERFDGVGDAFGRHLAVGTGNIRRHGNLFSAIDVEGIAFVGHHDDMAARIGNEGFAIIEGIAWFERTELAVRPARESMAFYWINGCNDLIRTHFISPEVPFHHPLDSMRTRGGRADGAS